MTPRAHPPPTSPGFQPACQKQMRQAGGELPAPKKNAIRQVLVLYSQAASLRRFVGSGMDSGSRFVFFVWAKADCFGWVWARGLETQSANWLIGRGFSFRGLSAFSRGSL